MYMIRRTDKEYGNPTVIHETIEESIEEARRLAVLHAAENGSFGIYKLLPCTEISGKIVITES